MSKKVKPKSIIFLQEIIELRNAPVILLFKLRIERGRVISLDGSAMMMDTLSAD